MNDIAPTPVPDDPSSALTEQALTAAHAAADHSGAVIRPLFRRPLDVINKAEGGRFDPVTQADRQAEDVLRADLSAAFPDHAILGEERGLSGPDHAALTWVLDPIDGTRAFITGLPTWGTLIALVGKHPVLGMMDQPYTGERFWASDAGAYQRLSDGEERGLQTRTCCTLAEATLAATHPSIFAVEGELEAFSQVEREAALSRYGADCYNYCMVAAGHIDVVIESGLQFYDVAALVPIVERAGGRLVDWHGKPITTAAQFRGQALAVGDEALLGTILPLLAPAAR